MLAAGLLTAGVGVPLLAGGLSRSTGSAQAEARGDLTADLVEVLQGAPELVLYGREEDRLRRRFGRPIGSSSYTPGATRPSPGSATGLIVLVAGLTTTGVLALAVSAHATGRLDRVLVATVALLALASFEAVATLPGAAQELGATLASGRRVLELVDRPVRGRGRAVGRRSAPAAGRRRTRTGHRPLRAGGRSGARRIRPATRAGRAARARRRERRREDDRDRLLLRFLDPESGRVTIGGRDVRAMRQEDVRRTFALAGQEAHIFNSTIRENLCSPGRTPSTPS